MKKWWMVCICLVLLVSMVSCDNKEERISKNQPSLNAYRIETEKALEYSKQLGDVLLQHYLGYACDTVYQVVLAGVDTIVTGNRQLYLDDAASYVLYYLQNAANYSCNLEGSPFYHEVTEEAMLEVENTYDATLLENFKNYIFPQNKAPNIRPLDADMNLTSEFIEWFIEKIKDVGLLDKRLVFDSSNTTTLFVNTQDCGVGNGGLEFKVFDRTYYISSTDVGIVGDDIQTMSKYQLILKSYVYYDTGIYMVTYGTDTSDGEQDTIEVTISFRHNVNLTGEYATELDEFLAGITQVSIQVKG